MINNTYVPLSPSLSLSVSLPPPLTFTESLSPSLSVVLPLPCQWSELLIAVCRLTNGPYPAVVLLGFSRCVLRHL